ncbi:MAG: PilZ domain-containing protein [Pseudomonadota bacterium]
MDHIEVEVPKVDDALIEKRKAHRRRVLKSGTLQFNNGYGAFDCKVRNLTEDGAMIEMGETLGIPSNFVFRIDNELVRTANIVWRSKSKMGLRFEA